MMRNKKQHMHIQLFQSCSRFLLHKVTNTPTTATTTTTTTSNIPIKHEVCELIARPVLAITAVSIVFVKPMKSSVGPMEFTPITERVVQYLGNCLASCQKACEN